MADPNDHLLQEFERLIQYLEPTLSPLTMPLTRLLQHANHMAERFWPEWVSEGKIFEEGIDKGIEMAKSAEEAVRQTPTPAEVTSASSTDWLALGACLFMAASMVSSVGKHTCKLVDNYFAYRTEMAHQVQLIIAEAESQDELTLAVQSDVEYSCAASNTDKTSDGAASTSDEKVSITSSCNRTESLDLIHDLDEREMRSMRIRKRSGNR
ncbi:hypothetical protein DOTSEDRAFT_26312 [Dothistroma septosporum NZE10]|uniref:Uncharacterized protein n=1 Tax=Dothistroma septosporum (strain NZE10 / CBS 128990) TaxID=675120 RepID=N1PJL2_DOTSN|nr:hypothetical protein DOTSEDRAFT_26312 [Dothistroma septosporum NZE10]